MNLKRTFLAVVGTLMLTTSLTAGVATAQETTSGSSDLRITVLCGANNTGPSTASLASNGEVSFEELDPSDPEHLALRSTSAKALRVNMNIDPCQTGAWHVDATITDFKDGDKKIPGTKFQLPIGGDLSSTTAMTAAGVEVPGVVAPSVDVVTFGGDAEPYNSSHAIASSAGNTTGAMSMDFTGQLANLAADTADGTYSAVFTVTYSPGAP